MSKTAAHRKYVREEKAKIDKQQTLFFSTGKSTSIVENTHRFAKLEARGLDPFKNVTCPYCLSYMKLRTYLKSTKKGFNKKDGKCSLCGNSFELETLVKMGKWTPEEYAQYVYNSRRSGFWQKIKFYEWKERMELMGWLKQFWDAYKKLKIEDSQESYSEYMDRLAKEDLEEKKGNYNY